MARQKFTHAYYAFASYIYVRRESHLQLFREGLSQKMCTRQSRKVIWDMINTLFLTLQQSNLLSLLSFSTCKHMSMVSRAVLLHFFEEQCTQNHPQYPSEIVACTFSDNLSRNSCVRSCFHLSKDTS